MNTADLSAADARDRMARGEFSAADHAGAHLARIAEREDTIGAFQHFDPDLVRQAAEMRDRERGLGHAPGPIHGLPVAVKDIVDTRDYPTENGTPIDAGRRPQANAALVDRLLAAGAVIAGKTVTTELAYFNPGKTRNPRNLEHTPGGSSSGSAAAVAAGMVPLAIGTQTNGSVIRPASFCGVVGYKPTHGSIARTGVLMLAEPLDTIGVFARTVADAALLADALFGFDAGDPATRPSAPPRLLDASRSVPPVSPALAFVKSPAWGEADDDTREGFQELADALGDACDEVALPAVFDEATPAHRVIMHAGMARNLERYLRRGPEKLSEPMRAALESGAAITTVDYMTALDWRESLNAGLEQLFDRYDAILTPAAPGEAPKGLDATGNPAFNGQWTLCGVPTISLPLLQGNSGLPIGVQLVGRRGDDARLLRTAAWLTRRVASDLASDGATA